MEPPRELRDAVGDRDDVMITTREYDSETVIAVDFGPVSDPNLDVSAGTATVVFDETQFKFDVPADANDVTVNDGVLTING
ncbi:hypothetical protein [Halosolutus gelatinilyticus]|uniref:hypothetical protein n=1 Tax=Halosolutus gelatinilyticus TaxID=2931975 RepID=UPI001FF4E9A2|nr:hypothetical protein [Halosolutus gelatinilyticus]